MGGRQRWPQPLGGGHSGLQKVQVDGQTDKVPREEAELGREEGLTVQPRPAQPSLSQLIPCPV